MFFYLHKKSFKIEDECDYNCLLGRVSYFEGELAKNTVNLDCEGAEAGGGSSIGLYGESWLVL